MRFAPVLHYYALQGDFVGGNFWDMRASGYRLQNPSAEQAQDHRRIPWKWACVAYRLSQAVYRKLFETVWGEDSFHIQWPADAEKVCSTPGPPTASDPLPLHLNVANRARADRAYDTSRWRFPRYEFSQEVSPFTSKYDSVQAEKEQFTAQEKLGTSYFAARRCNECHRDGGPSEVPLFTDFTASNLGLRRSSMRNSRCPLCRMWTCIRGLNL